MALPDGPGSAVGLPASLSRSDSLGALHYGIPLEVPAGFPEATPELALRYSSRAGNGPVGRGFGLVVAYIGRDTSRGQPDYTAEDGFVSEWDGDLVPVDAPGGGARLYRARVEGRFIRYLWHGAGRGGYWVAERPDGSRAYFGADR